MIISSNKQFDKMFQKASPQIQRAFKERVKMLEMDFHNPLLNKHKLKGEMQDYCSINVTGDWRVIFKELKNGEIIFFILLGTHSELYK